jgi:hypothetical protein
MEAKNLFVGILRTGQNVKNREKGWKKSQPVFINPYFS